MLPEAIQAPRLRMGLQVRLDCSKDGTDLCDRHGRKRQSEASAACGRKAVPWSFIQENSRREGGKREGDPKEIVKSQANTGILHPKLMHVYWYTMAVC